jgi:predicted DNA-binding protein
MSRRKLSTTIYITEEQNEALKRLHDETKVPVAEYIRQGIDLILERHRTAARQLSFDLLIGK